MRAQGYFASVVTSIVAALNAITTYLQINGALDSGGDHGEYAKFSSISEEVTLSTVSQFTNTTMQIPANAVVYLTGRITQTISGGGVTAYSISNQALSVGLRESDVLLTAGSTWGPGYKTVANGGDTGTSPYTSRGAETLSIFTSPAPPTQGKLRITVWYLKLNPPTS